MDQKKRDTWLTFFFRQEFLVGGLFDTRVTFQKNQSHSSTLLAKIITTMMNANNQPANQPANVGRQQQQGNQRERINFYNYIIIELKKFVMIIIKNLIVISNLIYSKKSIKVECTWLQPTKFIL